MTARLRIIDQLRVKNRVARDFASVLYFTLTLTIPLRRACASE